MGIKKTLEKVRNSDYYWPRMRQFVYDYVLACGVCEERKNPPQKKQITYENFPKWGNISKYSTGFNWTIPEVRKWIFLHSCSDGFFYKICRDMSTYEH